MLQERGQLEPHQAQGVVAVGQAGQVLEHFHQTQPARRPAGDGGRQGGGVSVT